MFEQDQPVRATFFAGLRDRNAEWDARLRMIRAARRFLYTSTYYIGADDYGVGLLEALGAAAGRGVACTLIVDVFGQWLGASAWTPRQGRAVLLAMRNAERAGVRVVWTRPRSLVRRIVGGGHHVKVQVSEAGPALITSSNLSRHSFEQWNEYAALLDGPVVSVLLEALRAVVPDADRSHRRYHVGDQAGRASLTLEWTWCNPSGDPTPGAPLLRPGRDNPITTRLIRAVEHARERIRITSFYFKPTASLRRALLAAARRGVQIEVFHSGPDALGGAELSWLAATADYATLLEAGVRIAEVGGGEHSKLVLVDDRWVAFGSYNLDHAAHDVVAEAMLCTTAAPVVSDVCAVFDTLEADPRARRIDDPRLSRRRRVKRRLLRPVRRWL